MAQTVRTLETGIANPEPGPEAHSLPCEVVGTDEELSNGSAKCQTPAQKRDGWRRNANRKVKVCGLLRLWIWIQFIAVPFYISRSRIGEADNPGHAHATVFGVQFEAIGQWAANLTSKSETELKPLLAQVGKCRQNVQREFRERVPCLRLIGQSEQQRDSQSYGLSPCVFPLSLEVTLHTLNNSAIISPSFKLVKNAITNVMEVGMFRLRCSFVTEVTNCETTPVVNARREEVESILERNVNSKLLKVW